MRRAARRDANERLIAEALRKAGCSVHHLDDAGLGDLLVGKDGVNHLLEVKRPAGRLTPAQKKWHAEWRGRIVIVRSVEEALIACGTTDARVRTGF